MSFLQVVLTEEAGVYAISGAISADTDLSPLLQDSHSDLIFRFDGINEITSVGIKKWVEGIQNLQQNGKSIEYQQCPESFVEQCNLVPEMTQGVKMHSFEVTFFCEDCDEEEIKMLEIDKLDLNDLPPAIPCPSCHEEMITEDVDAFKFIESF